VLADDGTNTNAHFKAIGYVNGLSAFIELLNEKIAYYAQKAKEEQDENVGVNTTQS
jgi:hypothetical protein